MIGPLWNTRAAFSHWLTDLAPDAPRSPVSLAIGIALLGAAALVFIVARQVRDVELHPYASIAPVLAVFSGIVLSGLRVELPFPGVSGAELGLAGLTLALTGGALAGRAELAARMLGWVLAAAPTLALVFALGATHEDGDTLAMLRAADPLLRAYLVLLAVSSLALALIAHVLGGQGLGAPTRAVAHRHVPAPRMTDSADSPAAFAARYVPGSYVLHGHERQARGVEARDSSARLPSLHRLNALARQVPTNFVWLAAGALAVVLLAGSLWLMKSHRDRLAADRARMERIRREQAALVERAFQEELPSVGAPVVTPLAPPVAARALPEPSAPVEARGSSAREQSVEARGFFTQEVGDEPSRRHHRRHRGHRERVVEARAPSAREQKPVAAPAPRQRNERELDFEQLMREALPGGGKNNGDDDPLLGL